MDMTIRTLSQIKASEIGETVDQPKRSPEEMAIDDPYGHIKLSDLLCNESFWTV